MQIEKTYPLSPQQAHLWSLQAGIETGMLPFRVQFLISITGPLDRRSLKEATGEIIRRHEILRTSPADREGAGVLQQVHACNNFVLDEQLLQGIPDSEHEQRIAALWKDSLELPLNANESLRMMFIHCSAHKSFLLVSLSAFCADLKSGEILARQLGQTYAAHQGGGNGAGKAVLQYGDVARWQNELPGILVQARLGECGCFQVAVSNRNLIAVRLCCPGFCLACAPRSPAAGQAHGQQI